MQQHIECESTSSLSIGVPNNSTFFTQECSLNSTFNYFLSTATLSGSHMATRHSIALLFYATAIMHLCREAIVIVLYLLYQNGWFLLHHVKGNVQDKSLSE
jgi:hypothetical protein